MSTNAQDEYFKAIGQRVLADQLAAQQQQQPPMDSVTAQRMRNEQIATQRYQEKQAQEIAEAQRKGKELQAQHEKQRADDQQTQAVLAQSEARQQKFANWIGANLPAGDFEAWWNKTGLQQWQNEQASSYQASLKAATLKRIGGNPF